MAEDTLVQLDDGEVVSANKGKANQRDFKVMKKLGEGGFGAVYMVMDESDSSLYAMKTESLNERCPVLKMEVLVLKALEKGGGRHYCKIYTRGRTDRCNFVIMTLAGKSISDLRHALVPPNKFTLATSIRIGFQSLEAIEDIHQVGYLHRDIKPANFANGRVELNEQRKIYILDFGLCRRYRCTDGSLHTPREKANFRGTTRYAPMNCFIMQELSRKDDLETWLYMLIELTRGSLPWRTLSEKSDVFEAKRYARTEKGMQEMFEGCPRQYVEILKYIDKLQYYSMPDYAWIYGRLETVMKKNNINEQDLYDWEVPERNQEEKESK